MKTTISEADAKRIITDAKIPLKVTLEKAAQRLVWWYHLSAGMHLLFTKKSFLGIKKTRSLLTRIQKHLEKAEKLLFDPASESRASLLQSYAFLHLHLAVPDCILTPENIMDLAKCNSEAAKEIEKGIPHLETVMLGSGQHKRAVREHVLLALMTAYKEFTGKEPGPGAVIERNLTFRQAIYADDILIV